MRLLGGLVLLLLFALPARADTIDYSLSVTNAPGGIGDVSWTIQTDGFIQPQVPANPIFDNSGPCTASGNCSGNCLNCNANIFTSFLQVTNPTQGNGCQIVSVFTPGPGYSFSTNFSPLCDGLYDALVASVTPDPGFLGTTTFQGTNPDDTQNFVTLTVTDVQTPEPRTWAMLWMGLIGLTLMKFAPRRKVKADTRLILGISAGV